MIHSLLKSLFLYSALATYAVLAAPAHHDLGEFVARGVSPREYLHSPHQVAPGLTAPNHAAIGKRLQKQGGGRPKKVTNAMRFAMGLPPLPPRSLCGSSGELLGYLSKNYYNDGGRYYLTPDCTKAMVNAQLFAGDLTNPAKPQGYPNVGIMGGDPSINSFATTELGVMSGTAAAPSGPGVQSKSHALAPSTDFYMESKVWSLGANNELFVTWINPNGDAFPLEICTIDNTKSLFVTPSVSAYRTRWSLTEARAPKLRFYVASSFTC
ncbi:hypothetical protein FS837_009471 [Tulasnella sp. UAMH 9824]|nr:hypothetical protein FS837_009471 [Tulasnella sp. UAMH 9824]